jgi:hypothetical protein
MRTFVFVLYIKYYEDDKMKKHALGRAYRAQWGRQEMCTKFLLGSPKEDGYLI